MVLVLSIVSRIAYWFGGEIQVDQSPNLGGARFTMIWPAKRYKQNVKIVLTDRIFEERYKKAKAEILWLFFIFLSMTIE